LKVGVVGVGVQAAAAAKAIAQLAKKAVFAGTT